MVGGEDTTAAMIQWTIYELSKHPEVIANMLIEHASVFGLDLDPLSTLSSDPEASKLLHKLPYTTAILKEILRLHPAAGTSRRVPQGSNCLVKMADPRTGKDVEISLDNTVRTMPLAP